VGVGFWSISGAVPDKFIWSSSGAVLEQFWSSCGAVLEQFSGSILEQFWRNFWNSSEADLEQFWSSSGVVLEQFSGAVPENCSGAVLEQFWRSSGAVLEQFRRIFLEQFWSNSGAVLEQFSGAVLENCSGAVLEQFLLISLSLSLCPSILIGSSRFNNYIRSEKRFFHRHSLSFKRRWTLAATWRLLLLRRQLLVSVLMLLQFFLRFLVRSSLARLLCANCRSSQLSASWTSTTT
jgi:hypothetical protein